MQPGRGGLSRRGAAAALSYVSLFRHAVSFIWQPCWLSTRHWQAFAVFCPVAAAVGAAAGAGDAAGAAVV